jgi:hypothetical protein
VTRPLVWMAAVRDHPQRPPSEQRHVLMNLALRLSWETSTGFASARQLAADVGCDERTVRRATAWARASGMLIRTKRGHRLGDGSVLASEWRLTTPQPDSDVRLIEPLSTGQSTCLNRTTAPSQPDTPTPPSRPSSSRPNSSAEPIDVAAMIAKTKADLAEINRRKRWTP